jgi:tRNA dimethylallyltransferase
MKKVIIITGPTAVGKTKLSIEVAKYFNMPLINGDAYQIYKHLSILTAKPTILEMENVYHYLMDELDPMNSFSIYDYQKLVRDLIEKIDLPIIVGGSGLYIDSVIYDYRFSDNNSYKFNDEGLSNEELHEILTKLDEENAAKIHPNNRKRVIRAIELAKTQNSAERSQNHNLVYEPLIICLSLEREVLYERINKRVLEMINNGLIEEVQNDRNKIGFQASKAIGFNDVCNYLDGIISKEEMINNIQKASRHYAKRQLTWYRNHPNTLMIDVNLDNYEETIKNAINKINEFLK